VVTVRLDDAYLVGPNVLIYTKFVNVSDGGRGVVECRTRFGVDAGSARPAQPRLELSKSGIEYTRSFSCEVSVKIA
jgi:hypothetical protein